MKIADEELEYTIRIKAREDLMVYAHYMNDRYVANWHHRVMAEYIEAWANGTIKKLMFKVPPQNGKTELATMLNASWLLGIDPDDEIGIVGYSDRGARKFNRNIRRYINSQKYANVFPETKLYNSRKQGVGEQSATMFEIADRFGYCITTGLGGPLTGNKITKGIIDDLISTPMQANSKAYRDMNWEYYDQVFCDRLHNDSQQLICMTPWNPDDIIGRILEREGDEWTVVHFPALKIGPPTKDDPRQDGEPLWPERHSLEKILDKKNKDPAGFMAQHQGTPIDRLGGLFKSEYFEPVLRDEVIELFRSGNIHFVIDSAYTDKTKNDPTGIMAFGRHNNDLVILDYVCVRKKISELVEFLIEYVKKHGTARSKIFIEPKASGQSLVQLLKRYTKLNVVDYKMLSGDKMAKANLIEPLVAGKRVKILNGTWNKIYRENMVGFGKLKHDESLDLTVMALHILGFMNESVPQKYRANII